MFKYVNIKHVQNKSTSLKTFGLTTSKETMIDFEVYQGSKIPLDQKDFGLGSAVVLRLAESLPRRKPPVLW